MTDDYIENSRLFAVQPTDQTFVQLNRDRAALLCVSVWPNINCDDSQQWSLELGQVRVGLLFEGKRSQETLMGPRGLRRTVFAKTAEVQIATFAGLGVPSRSLACSIGVVAADVRAPWLADGSSGFIGRFATEAKISDPFGVGGQVEWFDQTGTSLGVLPVAFYQDWQPIPVDALSFTATGTVLFRE